MKKFISSILVIILIVSEVSLLSIISTKKFISEESLKNTVEKIDITKAILSENPNSNNETEVNKIIDQVDKVVLEDIYSIAAKGNVEKDKVDSVINSNAVKDFTANYLNKVTTYVTTGEENKVTGKEITDIVKANINSVANEVGVSLDDKSKNAIVSVVDTYSEDIANIIPSPKSVVEKANPNMISTVQKMFSSEVQNMLIIAVSLSAILLIFINIKNWKFLKWLSLGSMASGAIVCIFGYTLIPTLNMILENQTQFILNILQVFADELKMTFLINGGIVTGLSLVVLVIYEAIHKKLVEEHLDKLVVEIEKEFEDQK